MNGLSRIDAFRADARRLVKQLRAGGDHAVPAARRFRQLRSLAPYSAEQLVSGEVSIRLKHALAVVATEAGFDSWAQLKSLCELDVTPATTPPMHEPSMGSLLNAWFADHADARAARDRNGGYVLPYRQQFFVCESEGIRLLGLDPDDPDWQRIGYDFARPDDPGAWARLAQRRWSYLDRTNRKEASP